MELKDSCRLCLGKEGEFYELFDASSGECTLADELNNLLDFKIENNGDLPASICANCYKINSFFKEFRRDCARVKDKLYQLVESGNTGVSVKLERTENCEGKLNEEASTTTLNIHPASYVENLRSSFHDAIVSGVDRASKDVPSQSLETKGKKRPNENSESAADVQEQSIMPEPLLALVKSEYVSDEDETGYGHVSDSENDLYQFDVVSDSTSLGVQNMERLGDSISNPSIVSASVSLGFNARSLASNVNEESLSPRRKRQRMEGSIGSGGELTRSPLTQEDIHHKVKEEEIEIFDHPEEDDFDPSDGEDSFEKEGYSSDPLESSSYIDEEEADISSPSSLSSDESDEDTEMLLCLALLL